MVHGRNSGLVRQRYEITDPMPAPTHFQIRWRCHRHLIIHYSDALRPITAPACQLHPSLSLAPEDPASRSSPCPHHPPLCSTNPTLTLIPRDPSTHTSHRPDRPSTWEQTGTNPEIESQMVTGQRNQHIY